VPRGGAEAVARLPGATTGRRAQRLNRKVQQRAPLHGLRPRRQQGLETKPTSRGRSCSCRERRPRAATTSLAAHASARRVGVFEVHQILLPRNGLYIPGEYEHGGLWLLTRPGSSCSSWVKPASRARCKPLSIRWQSGSGPAKPFAALPPGSSAPAVRLGLAAHPFARAGEATPQNVSPAHDGPGGGEGHAVSPSLSLISLPLGPARPQSIAMIWVFCRGIAWTPPPKPWPR
jgi:hypothetical protein